MKSLPLDAVTDRESASPDPFLLKKAVT